MKRPPTRRPTCGTTAGYSAHVRNREHTCDDCRAAHAAHRAARRLRGERPGTPCLDCGVLTFAKRCRECASRREYDYAPDVPFTGKWVRDGLIWRPETPERKGAA